MEVDIFPVFRKQRGRGKKRKPTSEVQKKLNQRNAERKLIRLLNTNFTSRDIRFDLTYSSENVPESPQRAQKELQNFLRRVKRYRQKNGLPELKYVAVTEYGEKSGRLHHHIVMSGGIDINFLSDMWGKGYTTVKPLRFDAYGIVGIAKYLIKEPILGKRWSASQNLEKPNQSSRDGRISQKKAKEMHQNGNDSQAEIERLYPGYSLTECSTYYNDCNSGLYITILMQRIPQDDKRRQKKKPSGTEAD